MMHRPQEYNTVEEETPPFSVSGRTIQAEEWGGLKENLTPLTPRSTSDVTAKL